MATLENVEIEPGDAPARVIVNSRTGTVVIGSHVRVKPAAVAHGSLSVTITERLDVSQPKALSQGETVVTPRSEISVNQPDARMFLFNAGVDLNDIVRAVNQVGAAPGDLVAILEALKEAGALRAELIVIWIRIDGHRIDQLVVLRGPARPSPRSCGRTRRRSRRNR